MKLKCGLLGETLRHSFSKKIHSVFADYEYEYYAVDRENFKKLIKSGELDGMNVTVPYKELAFSMCDEVSELAREAGCVNTVISRGGKIYGDNTDIFGLMYMLSKGGISLEGKNVVILGSGGTSKTARLAAKRLSAAKITVVSRQGETNYHNVYDLVDTEIVINTTPVGMYPNNGASLIDLSRFPRLSGVADVIYNPAKTKLILSAEELGTPCVSGIYMLVAQAFRAAEQFLGRKLPETLIEEAVSSVRCDVTNIVLIGMPGSGKTTVAKLVAEKLSKKLCDTDAEIEARFGMSPADIILARGEAEFREIEKKIVAEVSKESGLVISTGGGVVERSENYGALSQNGRIYFIERSISSLSTEGRPLSKDIFSLYEKRIGKYLSFADVKIDNNRSSRQTTEEILEDFFKNNKK